MSINTSEYPEPGRRHPPSLPTSVDDASSYALFHKAGLASRGSHLFTVNLQLKASRPLALRRIFEYNKSGFLYPGLHMIDILGLNKKYQAGDDVNWER